MSQLPLLIDAHIHIYPQCDLPSALNCSLQSMNRMPGGREAVKGWLLTERSDCQGFQILANQIKLGGYKIEKPEDRVALVISERNNPVLYLFAGRQIITSEGLEICALITNHFFPDRKYPALELIRVLQENGAIVALNWAPGKWFGARGRVVKRILDSGLRFYISDTTMRPVVWPTPRLMRRAQNKGFRLLYGSDPLPFKGEERMFGQYVTRLSGEFDPAKPAQSLRSLLNQPGMILTPVGRRSGPLQFAGRQWRIMREKKNRS